MGFMWKSGTQAGVVEVSKAAVVKRMGSPRVKLGTDGPGWMRMTGLEPVASQALDAELDLVLEGAALAELDGLLGGVAVDAADDALDLHDVERVGLGGCGTGEGKDARKGQGTTDRHVQSLLRGPVWTPTYPPPDVRRGPAHRSEEHTSELQPHS